MLDAKGVTDEFPAGYFGILKENCTISLSVSVDNILQKNVSFNCSHALEKRKMI
jgi:hypothetical protein